MKDIKRTVIRIIEEDFRKNIYEETHANICNGRITSLMWDICINVNERIVEYVCSTIRNNFKNEAFK